MTLATGHVSDGNMQTFDNGFTNSSIYINRAFIGWKPADWFVAKVGKQDNPFYTTDLVWDPDIRPAGLVETISIDKFFGGSSTVEDKGLSKDGKSVVTSTVETKPKWTLALNFGQFYYSDNNEYNSDSDSKTDAYIFGEQILGTYDFGPAKVTFAPSAYLYNAASLTGFDNSVSFQDSAIVSGASRKLSILTAPGDISFKVMGIPTKFYWDFAYNTQGHGRASDLYYLYKPYTSEGVTTVRLDHKTQDDIAWLAGVMVGQNKKAGDLSFNANFRQTGIDAVDPNLNDSDFALGVLNTQGVKAGFTYNFTDAFTGSVCYMYAWNLRKDMYEGEAATIDQKIANGNNVQVLQVDLMLKF
ncbi:MAG: putative porin [Chthoniobacteraceae bacterium]